MREVRVAVVDQADLDGQPWALVDDRATTGTVWIVATASVGPEDVAAANAALERRGLVPLDRAGCAAIIDLRPRLISA